MTKQEEIKEGIAIRLCNHDGFDWEWLKEQQRYKGQKDCEYYLRCTDDILKFEDSQGVVIKVDRELPKRDWHEDWGGESGKAGYELALEDMTGYKAVEPLIKKPE